MPSSRLKSGVAETLAIDGLWGPTQYASATPLKEFCPDAAIDLWWKDKLRRPNQKKRREYMKRTNTTADSSSTSSSESEESDSQTNHLLLTEWDDWMTNS